jgi:hypothetical protein
VSIGAVVGFMGVSAGSASFGVGTCAGKVSVVEAMAFEASEWF